MSGRKTFTAGDVLTAADVQDYLMDQSVMVFAGTAARASAIASPTEGMVTYRTDDDIVETYDGSAWQSVAPADTAGLVLITSQSFSATSSVSVNNCFTSTYGNYKVMISGLTSSVDDVRIDLRFRVSGTDNTASDYYDQEFYANGTSLTGSRQSAQTYIRFGYSQIAGPNHISAEFMNPQAASRTSITAMTLLGSGGPKLIVSSQMHLGATSFDGFSVFPASGTFSGTIRVYGYKNS
jgi:hypothetical protein